MAEKIVYGKQPTTAPPIINGGLTEFAYVPGKGWLAINPKTGLAWKYDENSKLAYRLILTKYDMLQIHRNISFKDTYLHKGNVLNKQLISPDLQNYADRRGLKIRYNSSGIPYAAWDGYKVYSNGAVNASDGTKYTTNIKDFSDIDNKTSTGTSKGTSTGTSTGTSSGISDKTNKNIRNKKYNYDFGLYYTNNTNDPDNPIAHDYFNADKYSNFKSAFNAAKTGRHGVFTWRGKAYNTMNKGDNASDFRQNHSDYDAFMGNLGGASKDGGWGLNNELLTKANLDAQGYNEIKTAKEQPVTPLKTRLDMFTNNDIRNLGFNNYSGLVSAVSNKANSNNNFVKALTDRYGSDTSKWNQSTIESELGVKSKYRRFGRGDFGDMYRSMASWVGKNNGEIDRQNLNDRTGSNGTVYSDKNVRDLFEQHPVKNQTNTNTGINNYLLGSNSNSFNSSFNPQDLFRIDSDVYKNATKQFQQGGQINMDEQQLQQAFLQYLMQQTGALNEQQLELVMQLMGEDGLKQAYAQFIHAMLQQQVLAAKFGAKLSYINYLNGKCPEGMQMQYYKVGGKLCKKCMKMELNRKLKKSEPSNPIDAFKCGRKIRK